MGNKRDLDDGTLQVVVTLENYESMSMFVLSICNSSFYSPVRFLEE